jgi:pyruvate dehydrogenase E2 component (dihydrolipoamide acetyltransferase)
LADHEHDGLRNEPMAHAVRMPKPGQMTEECTVVAWHKQVGDAVAAGDVLFEIETDKSNMDVEAFDDGVLLKVLAPEGATVPVNAVCAWIGAEGEAVPEVVDESAPAATGGTPAAPVAAAEAAPSAAAMAAPAPAASSTATPAASAPGGRLLISPRANRLVTEAGLDARQITGTGPGGRIVEKDVKAAIAARDAAAAQAPAPAPSAPAARPAATVPAMLVPGEEQEAAQQMSRMRRVIAERLTASWQSTPHFTVTVAADVTRLLALRQELKDAGTNLTVTDFVLAATAQTLAEFPAVNSRTDGTSIWPRSRVHLGLAVSIPDGLVVPVIRDADRLSVPSLHDRAAALAVAAREGSLQPDDMTGGTFTVSNLGMFGVEEFSAIINPGEAAILAVSSALPTAVAIGDGLAVRMMMKLTLSADHRLVDGELGARFLAAIRRRLEDVAAFRTELLNA